MRMEVYSTVNDLTAFLYYENHTVLARAYIDTVMGKKVIRVHSGCYQFGVDPMNMDKTKEI